jgi:N-acetylneuraminate lyase
VIAGGTSTMPVQPLKLHGLIAPAFTPMRADRTLDLPTIDTLAKYFRDMGVSGVFVCGTSGEGPLLTADERRQVLERWCAAAKGVFPVIAHVGHAATAEARALATHAAEAGAAAVAALPPFYFKPESVDDLVDCCSDVASAVPQLPFYYYHIPGLTGVRLPMLDLLRRAQGRVPNLVGLKFSDDDLDDFGACLAFAGDRYDLFYGRDEMLLPALSMGARAAIGSTYNFAAPLYRRMMRDVEAGDLAGARAAHGTARSIVRIVSRFGGLPAQKAMMTLAGVPCGPCRLPLRTLSPEQVEALREAFRTTPLGLTPPE